MNFRVCGPVIGLKRMPSAIPASSRVLLRALWSSFPCTRSAALRRSATADLSSSWISLSVATRVASGTTPRPPISSL